MDDNGTQCRVLGHVQVLGMPTLVIRVHEALAQNLTQPRLFLVTLSKCTKNGNEVKAQ